MSASLYINTACVVMYCHLETLINYTRFKAWEGEVNFTPDGEYNTAKSVRNENKKVQ